MRVGVWRRPGAEDVRVYIDQQSGYLMVHWDDAYKVPGCLSNGYLSGDPEFKDENIDWGAATPAEEARIREDQTRKVIKRLRRYGFQIAANTMETEFNVSTERTQT